MRDEIPASSVLCAVNGDSDIRLLRRLEICEGETGLGGRTDTSIGIALDVETTGIGDDD